MPEAFFYQLNGDSPEAVLPRMLDMALGKGWRIEVRGLARDRMERLDLALWGEGGEFRPHGIAGGPHDSEQPILLTVAQGQGDRDCLMALDGAPVSEGEALVAQRVCIVFDGSDPEALSTARTQWKVLTGAGLAARYYMREDGTWSLRQERQARS
ncbi:DNA polymerase III chi subunit [Rubellimicrobium mesophilum DSM 19309]|uniref:DNA polymerase III chi subunit n=1 Tax=Rubellimicrobium mesophilum DSM 19309 TaxID=442562 RepID=A0A017HL13_9RHOB|nr:DNA polymerase III subunit chi [Rubellimicrobium mesophilum]EYD74469.1 DNA polymerase III chi subunit [Rubellimicrobium mesophilum DSM 19309]